MATHISDQEAPKVTDEPVLSSEAEEEQGLENSKITNTDSIFFRFPSEIFFEVCDYLSDRDFLSLQLLSSQVRQKLPQKRVDSIHNHKTYYLCKESIQKLQKLSEYSPLAERVTKLTIDLESPYARLLPRAVFVRVAQSYSDESYELLKEEYEEHVDNFIGRAVLTPANAIRKPKPTAFQRVLQKLKPASHRPAGTANTQENPFYAPPPPPEGEAEIRRELYNNVYTLFERYFNYNPPAHFLHKDLVAHMTKIFSSLPNLAVLEFAQSNLYDESFDVLRRILREHNKPIRPLLAGNSENDSGFLDWLIDALKLRNTDYTLQTAYPVILYAVSEARHRLKEVKMGKMLWTSPSIGVRVSNFEPPYLQMGHTTGVWMSEAEMDAWAQTRVDNFTTTFQDLKRFEVCLDKEFNSTDIHGGVKISSWFKATIQNVEELRISRLPVVKGAMDHRTQSSYWDEVGILMETTWFSRLRRLEIDAMSIGLDGLARAVLHCRATMKELIYRPGGYEEPVYDKCKPDVFVTLLRDQTSIDELDMEILMKKASINTDEFESFYMCLRTKGNLQDDETCSFEVGAKHVHDSVGGGAVKDRWRKKDGWNDFIKSVEEFHFQEHLPEINV